MVFMVHLKVFYVFSPSGTVEKHGKYGLGELVVGFSLKSNVFRKQIQNVFTQTYLFLTWINFVTELNNVCYFRRREVKKCLSFCWKLSLGKRACIGSSLVLVINFVLSERHDSLEMLALCYCSLRIYFQSSNTLSREWLHYRIITLRKEGNKIK
jgi:hypothetical protein